MDASRSSRQRLRRGRQARAALQSFSPGRRTLTRQRASTARRREEPWQDERDHGVGDCVVVSADAATLDTLYRRQSPSLLRSLVRRRLSRDDALDVVQEVFAKLARLGGLVGVARPEAYVDRMASNVVRDRARASARQRADLHVVADERELPAPDPHAQLEARDTLRRLEAAMLKLKPRTRQIFMAHRLDGLSYAEIADRTGLSVKGVEKQMGKAIAQVDRMLGRA